MKKVLLTAVALFAFGFANAQDSKEGSSEGFSNGDFFITGSANFSSTKMGDVKADGYNVSPSVGYFVTDNIALGAGVTFGKSKMTIEDESVDVQSVGGNVGASYFFTPADKFSLFAGLGLGYNTSKVGNGETINLNTFSVAVAPGFNYFLNDHFAVQASLGVLGYTSSKFDVDGAKSTNTFALGLNGTDLNFGITYKF